MNQLSGLPGEPFREQRVALVSIVLLQDLTVLSDSHGGKGVDTGKA
jgi:hypothetical protein